MAMTSASSRSQDVERGGYQMLNINMTDSVADVATWKANDGTPVNVA